MAQIAQERISHLLEALPVDVDDLIKSTDKASKWAMAVDYTVPDAVEDNVPVQLDQGTKRIPVSRVGLLTSNRLVPQSMLPHKIDDIKNGTMVCTVTGASKKWTFTDADTGDKYVCPGPPGTGELRPDIGTIYRDASDPDGDGKFIYTQYRYVPDNNSSAGTANETGQFVPIPSDLVMVNGQGTVVSDNMVDYTRQVDIAIGNPVTESATAGNEKSILIDATGRLAHALATNVLPGNYPSTQPASLGFGDSFYVPAFTVNRTGHVTRASSVTVTVPNTAATTNVSGLVKIGTNIQQIGPTTSAGTTTPTQAKPYIEVAAVDHVHTASSLLLTHINDGSQQQTLAYNGSAQTSYDFRNILQVRLPANGPSAANQVLVSFVGLSGMEARWDNPTAILTPDFVTVGVADGTCSPSPAVTVMNSTLYIHGTGTMAADFTDNKFTGVHAGKTYVVCFHFILSHSAQTSMEEMTVTLEAWDSNTNGWVNVTEVKHVLDGSMVDIRNFINGSLIFLAPSNATSVRIMLKSAQNTWNVVGGNIQIAEVK